MDKDKSIEVLNTLIEINNDRIAGYETASNETDEADLKALFSGLMQTSQKCKAELIIEVIKLGGTPIEGTKTTGKLFRVWMDIKSALTGKDRKAILNSCEFGEDIAIDTYRIALRHNLDDINSEQQVLLNDQLLLIEAGHSKVNSLLEALEEAK